MAMKTVCGQQLKVRPRIIQEVMMTQTKEWTFQVISATLQPSGTLLLVVASAAMGHWVMLAATASVGQLLLTATTHAACTSSAMAMSIRRATSIGRTATQSVVSKNQNNSISESVCPSVARAYGRAFWGFILAPGARR
jgi:hypothetical protein